RARRLGLADAGGALVVEGLAAPRPGGHEEPRLGAAPAGAPLAAVADDPAVLGVVDVLPHVPGGGVPPAAGADDPSVLRVGCVFAHCQGVAVPALRVVVPRVLDELAVLVVAN